jgi:hypothetical protein
LIQCKFGSHFERLPPSPNAQSIRKRRLEPPAGGGLKRIRPLQWPREFEALRLELRWLVALLRDSEAFRLESAGSA